MIDSTPTQVEGELNKFSPTLEKDSLYFDS